MVPTSIDGRLAVPLMRVHFSTCIEVLCSVLATSFLHSHWRRWQVVPHRVMAVAGRLQGELLSCAVQAFVAQSQAGYWFLAIYP